MKDRIQVKDKFFKPYISNEVLMQKIDAVAEKINADYQNSPEPPMIVCVLNGAMLFTSELMKRFTFDCELISIKLSSYTGSQSTGIVKTEMDFTRPVKDRNVIVVEDIVDTGNTVMCIKELLAKAGAKDVKICTMLLKPEIYDKPQKLDYVGMEISNEFIVGFGLDYDELARNYQDIYILDK